jgi:DNA topoisomerase-1
MKKYFEVRSSNALSKIRPRVVEKMPRTVEDSRVKLIVMKPRTWPDRIITYHNHHKNPCSWIFDNLPISTPTQRHDFRKPPDMATTKKLSHAKLIQAKKDPRKAAEAAKLKYVTGNGEGITRVGKDKQFTYFYKGKQVRDPKQLERIKKLVIPPAWTNVWICPSANGHIQVTGNDVKGRKQYRYHPDWNELRNETKFHHLYEFGKLLPSLRKRIRKDIGQKELTQQKVLATAIDLMEKTYIRIGSESYEKENGSYGLTTLKDRHIAIKNDKLELSFKGKKGVEHKIDLKDRRLARIVKECRDVPGKTLFQYYEGKNRKAIDSGMLNSYIRESTAPGFSAKDIRTWAGSVQALEYFVGKESEEEEHAKRTVPSMLDWVSKKLGNTRNVCKKYYVHPSILDLCEQKQDLPKVVEGKNGESGFSKSEQLLMCILKKS